MQDRKNPPGEIPGKTKECIYPTRETVAGAEAWLVRPFFSDSLLISEAIYCAFVGTFTAPQFFGDSGLINSSLVHGDPV